MKYPPYKAATPLQVNDGNGLNDWLDAQNPSGDFLDVNVWLALADPKHVHHAPAVAYWSKAQEQDLKVWFNRHTMLGLVRLLSQRKVMTDRALHLEAAMTAYAHFLGLPFVCWMPETTGRAKQIDAQMSNLMAGLPARLSTDVYLAAVASTTGLRMVTFDADFKRFELENCLLLSA